MDPAIKEMNVALLRYFQGEKRAAAGFLGIGAGALACGVWALGPDHPLTSARWPLGALGVLQIVAGATVYLRTDGQIRELLGRLNREPAAYRAGELARMAAVMKRFMHLRWTETALLAAGLLLATLAAPWAPWCSGVGWGLLVQGTVTLALDAFAERRGAAYVAAIREHLGA